MTLKVNLECCNFTKKRAHQYSTISKMFDVSNYTFLYILIRCYANSFAIHLI